MEVNAVCVARILQTPVPEEVVHASLSVTAMSRVQQNLLFSSTYLQPTGRGDGALQVLVAGLWQGL